MADFTPSQSDPNLLVHERTYHAFSVFVRWSIVGVATALTVLTLWFATPAGFLAGLIAGLIVGVVGYFAAVRHEQHQPLDVWIEGR